MKLERDRYYYNRKGEVQRIVCVDGVNEEFPCFDERSVGYTAYGECYTNGEKSDYDIIRPVFEPGQKWKNKTGRIYTLKNFEDRYWLSKNGAVLEEKWLIENCEQVEDETEPDFDDKITEAIESIRNGIDILAKLVGRETNTNNQLIKDAEGSERCQK